ncbi:MAG: SMI1/KNR4 family protein [candidate division NC10 bacterium]
MSKRAHVVAKALGVSTPADYAKFLDTYGTYEADGVEVYGFDEGIVDQDQIPCVIGATRILRENAGLPARFLVIHHTGTEGEVVCLDTKAGEVVLFAGGAISPLVNSFSRWFTKEIIGKRG